MSRNEASPEAETTSYSPVRMRLTASSEVPKYFTLALQPVCCSKGVTQSTDLSVLPSSAYPGQARMSTSPSMSPSDCFMAMSGAEKPPPSAPSPPLDPPLSLPHPARPSASAPAAASVPATVPTLCVLIAALLHCLPTRRRASPLLLLHRPGPRRGCGPRSAPPARRAAPHR